MGSVIGTNLFLARNARAASCQKQGAMSCDLHKVGFPGVLAMLDAVIDGKPRVHSTMGGVSMMRRAGKGAEMLQYALGREILQRKLSRLIHLISFLC